MFARVFLLKPVSHFHYNKDYNFAFLIASPTLPVSHFHYNKDYN